MVASVLGKRSMIFCIWSVAVLRPRKQASVSLSLAQLVRFTRASY